MVAREVHECLLVALNRKDAGENNQPYLSPGVSGYFSEENSSTDQKPIWIAGAFPIQGGLGKLQ